MAEQANSELRGELRAESAELQDRIQKLEAAEAACAAEVGLEQLSAVWSALEQPSRRSELL